MGGAVRVIWLLAILVSLAHGSTPNWGGKYQPCKHHTDLLNRGHLELGVRLATANPVLAKQFGRAMDFWSEVLDIDWHEVRSHDCALELVDGAPELFRVGLCSCIAARSQLPSRSAFQGWIAFNPEAGLTEKQMFLVAVHEIGHLFGLPHNPRGSSVMYFLDLDETVLLERDDLELLAGRHKLRPGISETGSMAVTRISDSDAKRLRF